MDLMRQKSIISSSIVIDYLNMKILVMGLPGSGKTYLSERLQPLLESAWFNADKVRSMAGGGISAKKVD